MEASAKPQKTVSERLRAATGDLQELERQVVSGDCAPRVLSDFRTAVDNIRRTAWAVQQWIELQQQHRDPYTVLSILFLFLIRREIETGPLGESEITKSRSAEAH